MKPNESLYEEKLSWFKTNEKPEAVLVVGEDPELTRLVVAWSTVAVDRETAIGEPRTQSEHEWWEWLWRNTRYSNGEIMEKTGIRGEPLERKMKVLIGNRVLYPDGTVNSFVQRYLREKVLKLFNSKPRKTARAS